MERSGGDIDVGKELLGGDRKRRGTHLLRGMKSRVEVLDSVKGLRKKRLTRARRKLKTQGGPVNG